MTKKDNAEVYNVKENNDMDELMDDHKDQLFRSITETQMTHAAATGGFGKTFTKQKRVIGILEGIRTKRFIHMAGILYFGMFYGSFFSSAYKFLPAKKEDGTIITDSQLTTIGAIGSVVNGGARLFWGKI